MRMLPYAMAAHNAGLCVVPPREDGTKAPLGEWKQFQQERPTVRQLVKWYGYDTRTGLGAILGKVSGNLEMMEFDDMAAYAEYKHVAHEAGMDELVAKVESGYCEQTPKPGIHWLYRCPSIESNTKLARSLSKETGEIKVLIETRGEGGYAILAPSHGKVHPSGKAYEHLSGNKTRPLDAYARIAEISVVDRQRLFDLARSFDQTPRIEMPQRQPTPRTPGQKELPGEYFNRTRTWADVLQPKGWTYRFTAHDEDYWTRPGKDEGVSATTNFKGSDVFKVFSTSTEFDTEHTYTKFGVYTALEHAGDFKAAAREIGREMRQIEQGMGGREL
jgi:hypothetical protein